MTIPTDTPWGAAQTTKELREGITFVSTAGHGGFHVAPEQNAKIPGYMREESGWYEEDADWAIVATVFPEIFCDEDRARAEDTLRNWHPDAWESWTGHKLAAGQSSMRDRIQFDMDHKDVQVVIAAWGGPMNGVASGQVLVCAKTGGRRTDGSIWQGARESWHLVPAADYAARGPFGFVVAAGTPETDVRPYR